MSEINVTPFVDVMLVLLIIFMVSAPLLVNGVPLDLPRSQAGPVQMEKTPLTVSLDGQGRLALNQDYYETFEALIAQLKTLLKTDVEQKNNVFLYVLLKLLNIKKCYNCLLNFKKQVFHRLL